LRVGDVEQIDSSYRWNVHYYVNGKEVAVRPIYANPGESNQFDVKVCVGTYMASGYQKEVSFPAFKLGDIQISESTTYHKIWQTMGLEDFGIPKNRIGYGMEKNNTDRNFSVDFETEDYPYQIALEDRRDPEDRKSLVFFALFAGLAFMAGN